MDCLQSTSLSFTDPLEQWFSIFLMLKPFDTVLHIVVTPNHKAISLLFYNYKFTIVIESYYR